VWFCWPGGVRVCCLTHLVIREKLRYFREIYWKVEVFVCSMADDCRERLEHLERERHHLERERQRKEQEHRERILKAEREREKERERTRKDDDRRWPIRPDRDGGCWPLVSL